MHAEGVENHSRKEIRLDHKTGPLHRSSLLWDPICPIKKSCWQMPKVYCFMGGGPGGKDTDMCFHALERGWGCGEYLQVKA